MVQELWRAADEGRAALTALRTELQKHAKRVRLRPVHPQQRCKESRKCPCLHGFDCCAAEGLPLHHAAGHRVQCRLYEHWRLLLLRCSLLCCRSTCTCTVLLVTGRLSRQHWHLFLLLFMLTCSGEYHAVGHRTPHRRDDRVHKLTFEIGTDAAGADGDEPGRGARPGERAAHLPRARHHRRARHPGRALFLPAPALHCC